MSAADSLTDLEFLNRAWLTAIRTTAAHSTAQACVRFGLDVDTVVDLLCLSLAEVEQIAATDALLFRLALPPGHLMQLARIDDRTTRRIVVGMSAGGAERPANGRGPRSASSTHNFRSKPNGPKKAEGK